MSSTIPPLVCDTPPPIDEIEYISGDEDISGGANGSHFEHFEDEIPSSSLSYHHHAPSSIEDISSELNEINPEFHDVGSVEKQTVGAVLFENSIVPPSDTVNKIIGQNEVDVKESNRISQNRSSFDSLDVTDIQSKVKACKYNESKLVCINSQSLQSRRTEDSGLDEQELQIESSNLVNDETNTAITGDGEENLGITVVALDECKPNDFNLNERTIQADERSPCEIKSNEAFRKTIATVQPTVQSITVNCVEKALSEKFDADFSQFDSFQENRSVFSTTTVTQDPIQSVQNCEISMTIVNAKNTTHIISNEHADNEDDEFGDFSSFSPPTIAGSSSSDMNTAIDNVSMDKSETPPRLSNPKSLELDNLNDSGDIFDSYSGEIMTNNFQRTMITTNSMPNHETLYCKNTEYNLGTLLSTLFPTNMSDIDPENDFSKYVKFSSTNDQFQFMNELTIHLKNVENAKALKHQWTKSVAKTFLVKSLGIDSRNILHGEKWNSSAPKFAANLGMSPLEPMKLNTTNDKSDTKSTFKTAADVPAAQFDWNSSGLINPLDGSRKSALEERNEVPLESPKQWINECQKAQEPVANIASETPRIVSTIPSLIVPEMDISQPNKSNEPNIVFNSNPNSNIESVQTSDSYNVPGSSGTMKETHIFTPSKSQPATVVEMGLDSNSIDKKHSSDDIERVVVIKENVVKKEYRDIEYDPERVISLDEFSDFQFVNTTNSIGKEQIASERGQSPSIGLGSNAVTNDNIVSNSAIINSMSNGNGFEKTYALHMVQSLPVKQTTQIHKVHNLKNENYNQIGNLKRLDESMFVNNTNLHPDISVCSSADTKQITSQKYTEKHKITSNAPTMMLSSILQPQLISAVKPAAETSIKSPTNIEWPGPGIDTDQLMRLEQRLHSQSQVDGVAILANDNNTKNNSTEKYSEDDEWSEFVSVEQPQTPITNIISKNLLKQQNDEDDWSEFVSSTVPMNIKRSTSNTQATNFDIDSDKNSIHTSWNCNEMSNYMLANRPSSMYNVSINVSTLPDLRFVAPKSLVHMPNSSLMKK